MGVEFFPPSRVAEYREALDGLIDELAVQVNENRLARVLLTVGEMTSYGDHGYGLACAFVKSELRRQGGSQ